MTVDLTVPEVHLHIGGEARTTGSGGVHHHVFPATGEIQGPVPLAGPDDVDAAVRAAQAAYQFGAPGGRRSVHAFFVGSAN